MYTFIEGYCKCNFSGKIPPKENLTDILQWVEYSDEDDGEETLLHAKRRRRHENPSKSVLESMASIFLLAVLPANPVHHHDCLVLVHMCQMMKPNNLNQQQ
ncbi:Hypothetical predicted protein, partial [Paramuricea clavata]